MRVHRLLPFACGFDQTVLDATDADLLISSSIYPEDDDGPVGRCSAHFGTGIRDDYRMNQHANRLRLAGL